MAYRGYYGSDNTPAGAAISGFTEGARPFLTQIVQDQRKKKRQQERSQFIAQNLQALDPSLSAEDAAARANLQVAGAQAPAKQDPQPDLSALITDPEDKAYLDAVQKGDLDPEFALRAVQGRQKMRAQLKADETQFAEFAPTFKKLGVDVEKLRAAQFAGQFLSKEMVGNILFPSLSDAEKDVDRVTEITKEKSFVDLTVQNKLELTGLGYSEAELMAAYGVSDADTSPSEALVLRRAVAKDYLKGAALMSGIQGGGLGDLAGAVREAERFLETGGLPINLTPIFDEARAGMGSNSKKEMRDILNAANESLNWQLTDNEIEILLLELFKK